MPGDFKLVGIERFQAELQKMGREMHKEAQKAIDATGLSLLRSIKNASMRGNPTGNVYEKHSPRRTHTASAPGEPPAVDTGRLVGAITFKNTAPLTAEVTSNAVQAFALEFGRRDGSIAPRPAWVPAVEAEEPAFFRRLEAAIFGVIV